MRSEPAAGGPVQPHHSGARRSRLTTSTVVVLASAVGFAGSCFNPRDAPPPCVVCPTPAEFKEPFVPEFVRDNIKAALERPTIDPNYRDSLSDQAGGSPGFTYVPDALAEAAATPGFFTGWDKVREVQFMLNLLEASSDVVASTSVQLLFTLFRDTGELPGTNEARYEVQYEFTLTTTVADSTQEERYCGRAFWDLEGGDRNFWTLKTWEDLEPLPSPTRPCLGTMGLLRALSGQGN